jgi:hypothetical protein
VRSWKRVTLTAAVALNEFYAMPSGGPISILLAD